MHGAWGWGRGPQRLWDAWGTDALTIHRASRPTCSVVAAGIPNSVSALLKVANSFFKQGPRQYQRRRRQSPGRV